jgi:hypothetical protein
MPILFSYKILLQIFQFFKILNLNQLFSETGPVFSVLTEARLFSSVFQWLFEKNTNQSPGPSVRLAGKKIAEHLAVWAMSQQRANWQRLIIGSERPSLPRPGTTAPYCSWLHEAAGPQRRRLLSHGAAGEWWSPGIRDGWSSRLTPDSVAPRRLQRPHRPYCPG